MSNRCADARRVTSGRAFALASAVIVGCGVGPDPDGLPSNTVLEAIPTPFEYEPWWEEISDCSGIAGDLDRVSFLVVVQPLLLNGGAFPCGDGLICNGLWESPHTITLAPAHVATEKLVKHEMLHDLVGQSGHPPLFEQCDVDWGAGATDVVPG
jgi:hypothetical protein